MACCVISHRLGFSVLWSRVRSPDHTLDSTPHLLAFAAEFANAFVGGKFVTTDGSWLNKPTAVLRAVDATGNMTSALLSLAQPHYDADSHTLTFKVCTAARQLSLLQLSQMADSTRADLHPSE